MRTPTIVFFALAMLLVASTAAAAPTYHPRPAELREVTGVYRLDNGVALKVTNLRRRVFAQLGQRSPVEMVAVAENHFVSADRRMTMEFRPIAFGDQIVLTYPSDFNAADAKMVTVRLAAN
jgi:hypothetical protein